MVSVRILPLTNLNICSNIVLYLPQQCWSMSSRHNGHESARRKRCFCFPLCPACPAFFSGIVAFVVMIFTLHPEWDIIEVNMARPLADYARSLSESRVS